MEVLLSQMKMAVVLGRWVSDNEADTIFAKRSLMPVGGDGGHPICGKHRQMPECIA